MARPTKHRRICGLPQRCSFICTDNKDDQSQQILVMSIEEFETIRLMDEVGLTQEECAAQMDIARTTVQRIYESARKKLAHFLVSGTALTISGGNYALCENHNCGCQNHQCGSRRCGCDHFTQCPRKEK